MTAALKKFNIRNISAYMTISVTLIAAALYSGIATPSARGAVGTIALVFVLTAGLEFGLYKIAGFRFKRVQGLCLVGLALVYGITATFFRSVAFYQITFSVLTVLYVIIFAWAVFGFTRSTWNRIIGLLLLLGFLVAFLYAFKQMGTFSEDCYGYYDISQSYAFSISDIGKVSTNHQYVYKTDYNVSFPYFLPLVVFIINCLTDLGLYSGIFLNTYIILYTILVFFSISRYFSRRLWCGAMAGFLLLTTRPYIREAFDYASIPLALLVSSVCLSFIAKLFFTQKKSPFIALLSGILAGTVIATRFDGLVMGAFFALVMLFVQKENKVKNFILYTVGLFVMISPWVIYSIAHFNKLWVSDNSGTMFLVETSTPLRLSLPGETVKTLFNAPAEWLSAFAYKFASICHKILTCSPNSTIIVLACIILVFIYRDKILPLPQKILCILVTTIIYYSGKTFMYVLVGYSTPRYQIETIIFFTFLLMMLVERFRIIPAVKKRVFLNFICLVMIILAGNAFKWDIYKNLSEPFRKPLDDIVVAPEWVSSLDKKLNGVIDDKDAEILFLAQDYIFGGWTDWNINLAPHRSNWEKLEYVMNDYVDVKYILCDQEHPLLSDKEKMKEINDQLNSRYKKIDLGDGYLLYKVGDANIIMDRQKDGKEKGSKMYTPEQREMALELYEEIKSTTGVSDG